MLTLTMRSIAQRLWVVCFCLCWVFTAGAAESSDPQIEAIRAAWQQRQASAQTVVMKWTSTSQFSPTDTLDGRRRLEDKTKPDGFRTEVGHGEMRLAGSKRDWRFTRPEAKTASPFQRANTDGTTIKKYNQSSKGSGPLPRGTGYIYGPGDQSKRLTGNSLPAIFTFLPLDSDLTLFNLSAARVGEERGTIDGHECLIVTDLTEGRVHYELWVDPAQGYCVRRRLQYTDGIALGRIDITYKDYPGFGLVPTKWRLANTFEDGTADSGGDGVVTSLVLNEPIPDTEFELEFPPNTRVIDAISNDEYVISATGSIEQPPPRPKRASTGVIQPIDPSAKSRGTRWWMWSTLGIVGIVLAWWSIRRVAE